MSSISVRLRLRETNKLDDVTFSRLYQAEVKAIYNYVGFRLGYDDAEDITAEIFSQAWAKRNRYDPIKGTAKVWLWAIARHAVIDHYRRRRPSPYPLDTDVKSADGVPEEAERRGERVRLHHALLQLPEIDQEIISLRFGAGETNRSIAVVVGLNEANVAQRLRRALRKLQLEMETR